MKLKFVNNQNLLLTVTLIIFTVLLVGNSSSKNTDDFFDPADDSLSYVSLATSISENSSFIRQEFLGENAVETVRTPGYPFFIALFSFGSLKNIIFIQNILHVISAFLLFKLIENSLKFKYSYIVFLLYLFNPLLIALSQLLLTETISIFLINLLIYSLFKKRLIFTSVFIVGILPIIRPAYLILLIGIILFNKLFFRNISRSKRIIIIVLMLLPTSVWTLRNYSLTNQIVFSSITGMNLLEETASGVMSIKEDIQNGESFNNIANIEYEEKRKWSQILRNEVNLGDVSRVISQAPGQNPHLVASEYQSYAIKIILQNPIETFLLVSRAFIYNSLEPGDQIYNSVLELQNNNFLNYSVTILNLLFVTSAMAFFVKEIKNKNFLNNKLIFYILLLAPLLLLATPSGRFGIPLLSTLIYSGADYFRTSKNLN